MMTDLIRTKLGMAMGDISEGISVELTNWKKEVKEKRIKNSHEFRCLDRW